MSTTDKLAICGLSPRPRHQAACVEIGPACAHGEQLVLRPDSTAARRYASATRLLHRARDLLYSAKAFHPEAHQTVVIGNSSPNDFIPLLVNAEVAFKPHHLEVNRSRFSVQRPLPAPADEAAYSQTVSGLAFVSTWSNAWQELFQRAVVQIFERWCDAGEGSAIQLIPAAFGSSASEEEAESERHRWLRPFSNSTVWPLAHMPSPDAVRAAVFGNRPCNASCWSAYLARSAEIHAARPAARCFRRMQLCDFGMPPSRARPWSAMQAILHHHAQSSKSSAGSAAGSTALTPPDWSPRMSAHPNVLSVVFAVRTRRRRLHNLDALLSACAQWRAGGGGDAALSKNASGLEARGAGDTGQDATRARVGGWPRVQCTSHAFEHGLERSIGVLRSTDVLISPHGADLINGLAMHAGASVVEIMPTHLTSCPCQFFRGLYAAEPKVYHYTASSANHSYSSAPTRGVARTYNADLTLPVAVLLEALEHIVSVGGAAERYKFRDFRY